MYLVFEILATALMGFNVLHVIHVYIKLRQAFKEDKGSTKELRIIGCIYISLLVGFLVGYIAIIISNRDFIGEIIISQILFWGSVFVMVSVYVLKKLYRAMNQQLICDMTDLKLSLDTYISNIPGGVHHCILEPEPRVTYVSKGFTDITGFTMDDINSMYQGKYIGMVYKDDMEAFMKGLQCLIATESRVTITYRIVNKRGEMKWLSDSANVVRDSKGVRHIFAIVMDITNEINNAETDSLTGLLNKGAFNSKVKEYMDFNPQNPLGLFMIDLNFFKEVNDKCGHQSGDMVLVEAANYLKTVFSDETAIIGRVGGDEFMVLVENPESDQYLLALKSYLDSNFKICITGLKDCPVVTASVGYTFAKCSENYETVFQRADLAMYKEKEIMHAARK